MKTKVFLKRLLILFRRHLVFHKSNVKILLRKASFWSHPLTPPLPPFYFLTFSFRAPSGMIRLYCPIGLCPVTFSMFVNLFLFYVVIKVLLLLNIFPYMKKKIWDTRYMPPIRIGVILVRGFYPFEVIC